MPAPEGKNRMYMEIISGIAILVFLLFMFIKFVFF